MIKRERQLLIGRPLFADEISKDFLTCRVQYEVVAVTVLDSPEFRSVCIPSARFLPELGRVYMRHVDLLAVDVIHLLTDDLFYLSYCSPAQLREHVDSRSFLLYHVSSYEQLMALKYSIRWCLSECLKMVSG